MRRLLALVLFLPSFLLGQNAFPDSVDKMIIGAGLTESRAAVFLERLCDEAGGRLVGTAANERGLTILTEELHAAGYAPDRERFMMPGWTRGADEVMMTAPTPRVLRAVALAFVNPTPRFDAALVDARWGYEEDYPGLNVKGNIVLVLQDQPAGRTPLLRYQAIAIAAKHGAAGILFVNDSDGTLTLEGVSNFQGHPSPIPAFSITYEEGHWLKRLLERSIPVSIRIVTRSYSQPMPAANVVADLPGRSAEKIVIGAHVDAWDVGQGAVDNGSGSAILFEVARLLKRYSPSNRRTVEFVWFNGEELGLWGSKEFVKRHSNDSIFAMINMDMIGDPTGFNAGGNDAFIPLLRNVVDGLDGFNLTDSVTSRPGTNSDHMPFLFAGIPTLSLRSHLDEKMVKYYHELGDTYDKVNPAYLARASTVVAALVRALANDVTIPYARRSDAETAGMLKTFKLDERLKQQGEWPFKE